VGKRREHREVIEGRKGGVYWHTRRGPASEIEEGQRTFLFRTREERKNLPLKIAWKEKTWQGSLTFSEIPWGLPRGSFVMLY